MRCCGLLLLCCIYTGFLQRVMCICDPSSYFTCFKLYQQNISLHAVQGFEHLCSNKKLLAQDFAECVQAYDCSADTSYFSFLDDTICQPSRQECSLLGTLQACYKPLLDILQLEVSNLPTFLDGLPSAVFSGVNAQPICQKYKDLKLDVMSSCLTTKKRHLLDSACIPRFVNRNVSLQLLSMAIGILEADSLMLSSATSFCYGDCDDPRSRENAVQLCLQDYTSNVLFAVANDSLSSSMECSLFQETWDCIIEVTDSCVVLRDTLRARFSYLIPNCEVPKEIYVERVSDEPMVKYEQRIPSETPPFSGTSTRYSGACWSSILVIILVWAS